MLPRAGGDYSSQVSHVVDEILRRVGIAGPWAPLTTTGLAKKVYATDDVVIAIATDHPDAIADARTESVAAPVARAAGVRTPRLIAFDDSRALIDRPWSVWERVPGVPLRERWPDATQAPWREVGAELARLHRAVTVCPDPRGWLDRHARASDPRASLPALRDDGVLDATRAAWVERVAARLEPVSRRAATPRFLHGDAHGMNVIVDDAGGLQLIDWGDAGWGDPAIELAELPVDAWRFALDGYRDAGGVLDDAATPLLLWQRLDYALAHLAEPRRRTTRLDEIQRLAEVAPWRDWLA